MRCHICDRNIAHPSKHPISGEYEPCNVCLEAALPNAHFLDTEMGNLLTDEDLSTLEEFEVSPVDD